MFTPSIRILPCSGSKILANAKVIVLFPDPVLPTIPIFNPYSILNDKLFKTNSVLGLYLKFTF
jgi:hypothetical protein